MKVQPIDNSLSPRLDMARALAALVVLVVHVRASVFTAYGDLYPESQNLINYILFFVTRLGHEAVIVFFVLSGFLVGGNSLKDWLSGEFRFSAYFSKRLTRMYLVLLPSLLVSWLGVYYLWKMRGGAFPSEMSCKSLLGNICFLQTIYVGPFANNGPLWSLAYEFWYYLLWPAVLLLFKKGIWKKVCALTVLVVFAFVAPHIVILFPLWVFGAMIRILPSFRLRPILLPLAVMSFIGAATFDNILGGTLGEYATGITFAGILICWMFSVLPERALLGQVWKKIAAFSFSLYAIHYPLNFLIIELLNRWFSLGARRSDASIVGWLWVAGISIFLIFVGWVFYLLFEKNTYFVRKWVSGKLGKLRMRLFLK